MHTVSQLLKNKQNWNEEQYNAHRNERVFSIAQSSTILEAAKLMNDHHIGSLIATDTFGDISGIISERDILTQVVATEQSPATTLVSDIMTKDLICCDPSTTVSQARSIMREEKIRHLPVIHNESVVGMISIGDLNAASNADLSIEVKAMREYITQG